MNAQDIVKRQWTVKHDEIEFKFETLDAAIWYAAGAASVSNSIRQINTRERLITLLPVELKHVESKYAESKVVESKFSCTDKCAA